jgi:hypothetical protein
MDEFVLSCDRLQTALIPGIGISVNHKKSVSGLDSTTNKLRADEPQSTSNEESHSQHAPECTFRFGMDGADLDLLERHPTLRNRIEIDDF